MPDFSGFCGRFHPTPCSLSWASSYPNKVGIYPSSLLPARRTVYHAESDGGYNFSAPLVGGGETFGLPTLGGLVGFGNFGPPQFDTFSPQTHTAVIFARTANRVNISHIITQAEIDAIGDDGTVFLDVGEYVFEAIAVTDQKEVINTTLSDQDQKDIANTKESISDRTFRKLFEQKIPQSRNRLLGIKPNKLGIEYRLDNGGSEISSALHLAGVGDLRNREYRDGSSRILQVNLKKITSRLPLAPDETQPTPGTLQADAREPKVGDTIFLTYVAITEHYIRQSVESAYMIQAIANPPTAYGLTTKIYVANYRFYEWNIQDENKNIVKLAGWRVVETFNIPSNVISMFSKDEESVIGQIPRQKGTGIVTINTLNTNNITITELQKYIDNASSSANRYSYTMNLNQNIFDAAYHSQTDQSYKQSQWYQRHTFQTYTDYVNTVSHVWYNTHPQALLKRDIDKWGIDRFLAQEIESDIKSGNKAFVPFMDDVAVRNPINEPSDIYLSNANTKFSPIQPISRYTTANLEIDAGVAGSITVGRTGSVDDIVAVFNFTSNIITENFQVDTRVLVERHFTIGSRGISTVAIEGLAGPRGQSLSCIADPSQTFSFLSHSNNDRFLTLNKFHTSIVHNSLSTLQYRPDIIHNITYNDPQVGQFVNEIGFSGLLGNSPSISPGLAISYANYGDPKSFEYITNNKSALLAAFPNLTPQQIIESTVRRTTDRLIFTIDGYVGRTELHYTCDKSGGINGLIQFKSGSSIVGVIDTIYFQESASPIKIIIPHYWMKGDTLEIVSKDAIRLTITSFVIQKMHNSKALDFSENQKSSSRENKNSFVHGKFSTGNLLFETNVMSISEDEKSRLFIFFNDKDNGISCVQSDDFAKKWYYHYGLVESTLGQRVGDPFAITVREHRGCYLFFTLSGKIWCKFVPFTLFRFEDAMLLQRFIKDVLQTINNQIVEKNNLFSSDGRTLRRELIGFVCGGDLTDANFWSIVGRNQDNHFDVIEKHKIQNLDGSVQDIDTRKNPFAISNGTAFTNYDIDDIYFSAYRNDSGVLKLFFLLPTKSNTTGTKQLQCHFSVDNGQTWYDYWEWIDYGYSRLKNDSKKNVQFIDRNNSGSAAPTAPTGRQESVFGINIHWSRLSRHKKEKNIHAESIVIGVDSPYVFYHSMTKKVFIFYMYQSSIFCKIINDALFNEVAVKQRNNINNTPIGMSELKQQIEKNTRSYFVDGDLSSPDIREEIHRYYNKDTNEIMSDGNVIFNTQWGINAFNTDRKISPQRICAYELPEGGVRLFYKHDKFNQLCAAIWTGSLWILENLLNDDKTAPNPDIQPPSGTAKEVCGGFATNQFSCV